MYLLESEQYLGEVLLIQEIIELMGYVVLLSWMVGATSEINVQSLLWLGRMLPLAIS